MVCQLDRLFPTSGTSNYGFVLTSTASHFPTFELLIIGALPDLHTFDTGQFFPQYTYVKQDEADNLLDANAEDGDSPVPSGGQHHRRDPCRVSRDLRR